MVVRHIFLPHPFLIRTPLANSMFNKTAAHSLGFSSFVPGLLHYLCSGMVEHLLPSGIQSVSAISQQSLLSYVHHLPGSCVHGNGSLVAQSCLLSLLLGLQRQPHLSEKHYDKGTTPLPNCGPINFIFPPSFDDEIPVTSILTLH